MFTDVVGYSAMAQRNEAVAVEMLGEQRRIIRAAFKGHGGSEIKTMGDGSLVEFASAIEATKCAVEIQKAMRMRNSSSPPERQVSLRIGLHVGDIIQDGRDIVGDGVNVASRVEPLAAPGGICLSRQVYDHVRNKLDEKVVSLGTREMKNMEPVEVYEVVLEGDSAAPGAGATKKHRLAVLPLANISANSEDEYFTDGLTEELISKLSRIAGLSVIARTSTMKYKGTSKGVAEIGRELNVESVVEGSVRRMGGKLRITAELVDARTEENIWSQQYDRDAGDVFAIQSDIAHKTADALNLQILVGEREGLGRFTKNVAAYQAYLRGRYFWNKRNKDSLEKAAGYFRDAIKKDPKYAPAFAGSADAFAILALLEVVAPKEACPEAKSMVERA